MALQLNVKRNLKSNNVTNDVLKQDLNSNGLPLLHDELLDYEQNEELKKLDNYTLLTILIYYLRMNNISYSLVHDEVFRSLYVDYIREWKRRKTLYNYSPSLEKKYITKINTMLNKK